MKSIISKLTNLSLLALTMVVCAGLVKAQSTDPTNPTPLTSTELSVKGPKKIDEQYYYRFSAGPGEVTLTVLAKAKQYSTFIGIKVYNAEMNTLASHNMSATQSSPGTAKKKIELVDKQTLLLSFTSDPSLAECKITLGGAVDLAPPTLAPQSGSATSQTSASDLSSANVSASEPKFEAAKADVSGGTLSDAGGTVASAGKNKSFLMSLFDAAGQRFNVPADGKLRIEMKDGTVQEIELAQVKRIRVKKQ